MVGLSISFQSELVRSNFNEVADRYRTSLRAPNAMQPQNAVRLLSFVDRYSTSDVESWLDVGCGTGLLGMVTLTHEQEHGCRWLSQSTTRAGFDASSRMVTLARRTPGQHYTNIFEADLLSIEPHDLESRLGVSKVGLVLSNNVIHWLFYPQVISNAFASVRNLLRNDAVFAASIAAVGTGQLFLRAYQEEMQQVLRPGKAQRWAEHLQNPIGLQKRDDLVRIARENQFEVVAAEVVDEPVEYDSTNGYVAAARGYGEIVFMAPLLEKNDAFRETVWHRIEERFQDLHEREFGRAVYSHDQKMIYFAARRRGSSGTERIVVPAAIGSLDQVPTPEEKPKPGDLALDQPGGSLSDSSPRIGQTEANQVLGDLPAEKELLYWNTRFPRDSKVRDTGVIFVGSLYDLQTAIEISADPEAVESSEVEKESLFKDGPTVPVRFMVKATGAEVRRANSEFGHLAMSDVLPCSSAKGSPGFEVQLRSRQEGPVRVEVVLHVREGAVRSQTIELVAIRVPTLRASRAASSRTTAQASTPISSDLASILPTKLGLTVSLEDKIYNLLLTEETQKDLRPIPALKSADIFAVRAIGWRQKLLDMSEKYSRNNSQKGDRWQNLRVQAGKQLIFEFARLGHEMYVDLFGDPGNLNVPEDLKRIGDLIARSGLEGPKPTLQISAELLPIPWAVMYDGVAHGKPPSTPDAVEDRFFWGKRFMMSRVCAVVLRSSPPNRASSAGIQPCINPKLKTRQEPKVASLQKQFFTSIAGWIRSSAGVALKAWSTIESKRDFERYLQRDDDSRFLYFFCHARAAKSIDEHCFLTSEPPDTQASILLDSDDVECAEWMNVAWMETARKKPLSGRPLVFMNACSSVQGDFAYQSEFVRHFIGTWRARGFIGTDWNVPTLFADSFGRLVLEKFLKEKKSVGEAFSLATDISFECDNPFALIYGLYTTPEVVL